MNSLFALREVSFKYNSRSILGGINWELGEGEHCALLGPNGAGKTTLLRLLNLLLRPTGGTLTFRTQDVSRATDRELRAFRRQMAFVFQAPVLFTGSVRRNLEYGLTLRGCPPPERIKKVEAILEQAGLEALAAVSSKELSGGEAQRVAVARALVLEPKVLLLDEPTTNLDRENQRLIENLLEAYAQKDNTTLLLVTHSLRQAKKLTPKAVVLEGGRVKEKGAVDQVELTAEDFNI